MFRLGELFCGPGGMALGAGLAGEHPITGVDGTVYNIRHVWGVDKDPDAIKTYQDNVAARFGGEGICVDATEFVENMTPEQKAINALAFGFPCNDFSLVGDQTGLGGKFGSLYRAGVRAIEQTNPYWFVAENVSGINSADGGKAFQKILKDLMHAGKGYVLTANLYRFEEYGVPQYRHRFIIVGIRSDLNLKFQVPRQTTPDPSQYKTVEEALRDIPAAARRTRCRFASRVTIRAGRCSTRRRTHRNPCRAGAGTGEARPRRGRTGGRTRLSPSSHGCGRGRNPHRKRPASSFSSPRCNTCRHARRSGR